VVDGEVGGDRCHDRHHTEKREVINTAIFTATEYSLIWRMLDLLGFPGLALYLILGKTAVFPVCSPKQNETQ